MKPELIKPEVINQPISILNDKVEISHQAKNGEIISINE